MTSFTRVGSLTEDQVRETLTAATAAPSLHNSQPWRFLCTPTTIEMYADAGRDLPVADPEHRAVMLACGAALLNLRLAIRARGVACDVRIIPDPADRSLLAVIRPEGLTRPTTIDQQLAAEIFRRHTDRRPFLDKALPEDLSHRLQQAARIERAWLAIVRPVQLSRLRRLLAQAHDVQLKDPLFVAEWANWTGRDSEAIDGVPARSSGPRPEQQDIWVLRDFSGGTARSRVPGKDFESDPLIAVIGSFNDLPLDQLRAGQAMQRVLLSAAAEGISASFLSQVVEVSATRVQLRELLGGGLWPQTVLRLGYGSPAARTPRRDIADVIGRPRR